MVGSDEEYSQVEGRGGKSEDDVLVLLCVESADVVFQKVPELACTEIELVRVSVIRDRPRELSHGLAKMGC
jgi:hypothetical protein